MDLRLDLPNAAWISFLMGIFAIVAFIVHIILSYAIYIDAKKQARNGGSTKFIPPLAWMVTTLATSIAGAAFYWVIHHSSFSKGTELDSDCLFESKDKSEPVDKWENPEPKPPESE